MIRLHDIQETMAEVKAEVLEVLPAVLDRGLFHSDPHVVAFAEEFGLWLDPSGGTLVAPVSDGTMALALALRSIRPKRVAVPVVTFTATAEAVVLAGAEPVLCDVTPEGFLDWNEVPEAVDAVIPVHVWGAVAPPPPAGWRIPIIEDACQAHGAPGVGYGAAACYSFYPTKNLGAAGDAGAVASHNVDVTSFVRHLGNHARLNNVFTAPGGCTSRLDAIQAVVLRKKLKRLTAWTLSRRVVANTYRDYLGKLPLTFPGIDRSVFHVFPVLFPSESTRDAARGALKQAGVETAIHYASPLHHQPAWDAVAKQCPNADKIAKTQLSLPCHSHLLWGDVERISEIICKVFG